MHDTAMMYGEQFFTTYLKNATGLKIVDLGAQDVNGSLRSCAPINNEYIGVDFATGNGVDIVLTDPYVLPFENSSIDAIVSSSCFEHSEFFWLTFLEAIRVLKPNGLLYINAPSNGPYHRYPVDCWRFYPDSGVALQNWGNRNGYKCALLESFIGQRKEDLWHDFVAVFVADRNSALQYPDRVQKKTDAFMNGRLFATEDISNHQPFMGNNDQNQKEEITKLRYELSAIRNSKSWRYTAPIRRIMRKK